MARSDLAVAVRGKPDQLPPDYAYALGGGDTQLDPIAPDREHLDQDDTVDEDLLAGPAAQDQHGPPPGTADAGLGAISSGRRRWSFMIGNTVGIGPGLQRLRSHSAPPCCGLEQPCSDSAI
jgi:hypothetical protein